MKPLSVIVQEQKDKLLDCFLEIEESCYKDKHYLLAINRSILVRKFIKEFGVNRVTVRNYTNMMQLSSFIGIDMFDSDRWAEGNLQINLGSQPNEIWASREAYGKPIESFDFKNWKWNQVQDIEKDDDEI